MNKRRSLTPNAGMPNVKSGTQPLRRGGTRQTVSDRVTFRSAAGGADGGAARQAREGWALNISKGGIRAILDEDTGKVELGEEYEISVGDADPALAKRGRIVWLQEEPDGFVVGVEYVGLSGTQRAAGEVPPAPPSGAAVDASGVSPAATAETPLGSPGSPDARDPKESD